MDRQGAIDLLQEVEENLDGMRQTSNVTSVKVKAMLEHLRSALEYTANDIFDFVNPGQRDEDTLIYFPYGKPVFIDNFFIKKLKIKEPNTSPFYQIIKSIQDYHTGENWLMMLCNLTNEVKHRNPLPFDKEKVVIGQTVSLDGMNIVRFEGQNIRDVKINSLTINGVTSGGFTYDDGKFVNNSTFPLNITLNTENKIKFHGMEYEVIPFIAKCIHNIREFVNAAYAVLEQKQ